QSHNARNGVRAPGSPAEVTPASVVAPVIGAEPSVFGSTSLRMVVVPAAVTAFLWLTSVNDANLLQVLLCFCFLCLPWWSFCAWRKRMRSAVPFFALVSFMYWLFFAVPFFWGDRFSPVRT